MTDNIRRMYRLAGTKEIRYDQVVEGHRVKYSAFPPFTAEKQLELIKWLASEHNDIEISWYSDIGFRVNNFLGSCEHADLPQALAGLVCELWEDLTDSQREEIKRILQ